MKIVEVEGKKLVVFEDSDAELKENFDGIMLEMKALGKIVDEKHEILEKAMDVWRIAIQRLELFKAENSKTAWVPVESEVKRLTGLDNAPMSYDFATETIELKEPAKPRKKPDIGNVVGLLGLLGGLGGIGGLEDMMKAAQEIGMPDLPTKDDDETVH